MNLKHLSSFLSALFLPLIMWGQLTAEQAFINATPEQFPYIKRITRLDMVDYFKSGSNRPSQNLLNGFSRILSMTPEKIVVEQATDGLVVTQMALDMFNKKDTALIVIENIATPAMDGNVKVYDTSWQCVNGAFIPPTLKDWIKKGAKKEMVNEIMTYVPFAMARYDYDPESHTLTLTASFADYLPEELMRKVGHALYTSKTYKWRGNKFVKAGSF